MPTNEPLRTDPLTRAEEQALRSALPTQPPALRAAVLLCLDVGLTVAEMFPLQWGNVVLQPGSDIPHLLVGGRRSRTVYLPPAPLQALRELRAAAGSPSPDGRVFPWPAIRSMRREFYRLGVTPRRLRATYLVRLVADLSGGLTEAARLAGVRGPERLLPAMLRRVQDAEVGR